MKNGVIKIKIIYVACHVFGFWIKYGNVTVCFGGKKSTVDVKKFPGYSTRFLTTVRHTWNVSSFCGKIMQTA